MSSLRTKRASTKRASTKRASTKNNKTVDIIIKPKNDTIDTITIGKQHANFNPDQIEQSFDNEFIKNLDKSRLPEKAKNVDIKYYDENVNVDANGNFSLQYKKFKPKIFKDEVHNLLYIPIHLGFKYNINIDEQSNMYNVIYKRRRSKIYKSLFYSILLFLFVGLNYFFIQIFFRLKNGTWKFGYRNRMIIIKIPPHLMKDLKTNKAFDVEQLVFD